MNFDDDGKILHCASSIVDLSKLLPFFLDDPAKKGDIVKVRNKYLPMIRHNFREK